MNSRGKTPLSQLFRLCNTRINAWKIVAVASACALLWTLQRVFLFSRRRLGPEPTAHFTARREAECELEPWNPCVPVFSSHPPANFDTFGFEFSGRCVGVAFNEKQERHTESTLIGVLSSTTTADKESRESIRNSWARGARVRFFLGWTNPADNEWSAFAQSEDIVLVDVKESYKTGIRIKSLAMVALVAHLTDITTLVKTDLDTWLDIKGLQTTMSQFQSGIDYGGFVFHKARPQRSPLHKWAISVDAFPGSHLPSYASGAACTSLSFCQSAH